MKILRITRMLCAECGRELNLRPVTRDDNGQLQWKVKHDKYESCSQSEQDVDVPKGALLPAEL